MGQGKFGLEAFRPINKNQSLSSDFEEGQLESPKKKRRSKRDKGYNDNPLVKRSERCSEYNRLGGRSHDGSSL